MRIQHFVVAGIFFAFLAAPIASLLLYGPAATAENSPTLAEVRDVLVARDESARNDVARRLTTGTPVGIAAIRAHSYIQYDLVKDVDTSQVISGIDGWLFLKQQFHGGRCLDQAQFEETIATVEAMRVVAEGAGIDLRFSVSPDKSVVHPEKLGSRTLAFAGCKLTNAARWRAIAKAQGSSIIDHLDALTALSRTPALYFATDTHWKEKAFAFVMKQLGEIYLGRALPAPTPSKTTRQARVGDLMQMLRLENPELAESHRPIWPPQASIGGVLSVTGRTLIVHDSFYGRMRSALPKLFPELATIAITQGDFTTAMATPPAHILVNSIERFFFSRLLQGRLSWQSGFGPALLRLNQESAHCVYHPIPQGQWRLKNLHKHDQSWRAERDPHIIIPLPEHPGGRMCIRVRFRSSAPSMAQIFLPQQNALDSTYTAGYAINFPAKRDSQLRELSVVLPGRLSKRQLRIDPVVSNAELSEFVIETGLAAPRYNSENAILVD